MSVRNTVVFTTWVHVAPADASTAPRLLSTCSVCATTSPSTTCIDAGSRATWPAEKRNPLAMTACEYGPMAAGALSECVVLSGTRRLHGEEDAPGARPRRADSSGRRALR